ncbi:hypothetical protein L2E82_28086 [Cichorium intybus]|uniref:Uncharacterized protein n=1 Tax=Cichorium intybus TaxID=13427 RepID=A0ACB9CUN0_CICIN|nr:hypothetical protein L2E82_28086 [Cichorium intybus]
MSLFNAPKDVIPLVISKQTNVPLKETRKKVWLVDSKGLIVKSHLDSLQHFKKPWAHDHEPVNDFLDAVKVPDDPYYYYITFDRFDSINMAVVCQLSEAYSTRTVARV